MKSTLLLLLFALLLVTCFSFLTKSFSSLPRHGEVRSRKMRSAVSSHRSVMNRWQRTMQLRYSEEEEDTSADVESKVDEEIEEFTEEDETNNEDESMQEEKTADELDPVVLATTAYEKKLAGQLASLESTLKSERMNLLRAKDKMSESGKNGFFMVQAQVNEFGKKKNQEQKMRVERSKREFVEKMLPVLDEFRNATLVVPPETEREATMHKSFESLLNNVLSVFEKYGYVEYDAEEGSKLDPLQHEIVNVVEQEGTAPNTILKSVRPGLKGTEGPSIRKAQVVVSIAPSAAAEEEEEASNEEVE